MNKTVLRTAILTIIISLFTACVKDEDTNQETGTAPLTKMQKLTSKFWIVTSFKVTVDNGPEIDQLPLAPDCKKDDLTKYNTDYTMQIIEGDTKCENMDSDLVHEDEWAFSADENYIVNDGDSVEILYLTNDELHIRTEEETANGELSVLVATYEAR